MDFVRQNKDEVRIRRFDLQRIGNLVQVWINEVDGLRLGIVLVDNIKVQRKVEVL